MIDNLKKVMDLERETNVKLDLTEREKQLLEAVQYLLDKYTPPMRRQQPQHQIINCKE